MKSFQFVLCPINFTYWKLGWDSSVRTVTKLNVGQLRKLDLVCDRGSNWSFSTTSNEVYGPTSPLNRGWFPQDKAYIHPVSRWKTRQPTDSHTHMPLWHHAWSINMTKSRVVIGLLTGHITLRRHLYIMGLYNNPTCRKCGNEEETSVHILCECEVLASLRHTYLGSFFMDPDNTRVPGMGAIWNFAKGTGFL